MLYMSNSSNYNNKQVGVPNLNGYSREKAVALLASLGLKAEFQGEGLVSEQSFDVGEKVNKGTTITLTLETIGD